MKQQELLAEFAKAIKVYEDSSKLALALERSIDGVLDGIALHKNSN